MHKHRSKLNSDDEIRSQKSHYTHVSKLGSVPSKNVELSLEVELDDEVRNILKKCPSALVDVTVIKPKGQDQYTTKTQILKIDQVKKLIESMQLEKTDKKKLMEKLFGIGDFEPIHQAKPTEKPSLSKSKSKHSNRSIIMDQGVTDDNNSMVFSIYNQQHQDKQKMQQQIYTTPKTYENIRRMFACKLKENYHNENDKIDQPCLCQNCAIVGILTDSQKKPFATEPIPDPAELKEPSRYKRLARRKSVNFKPLEDIASASRSHDQCQAIFKVLSARINELEKRVLMQEEKAVPKDYFKKIITKLVTHLSRLTHYTTEERNLTQTHRPRDLLPPHTKPKYDKYNRYHVNPVLVKNTLKFPAEKEYDPKPCSSVEAPRRGTSESIWKWGEDVLTTGRDMKNKVVVLLEETLHNLKKGWEKPQSSQKDDEDDDEIQCIVDELSKNLAQTIGEKARSSKEFRGAKQSCHKRVREKSLEKKTGRPSLIPKYTKKKDPAVNVAYVNRQMMGKWPEESAVSFKIDLSDYDSHRDSMNESKKIQYKKEFLRILENTKMADKYKLWQNIWNQALENRQNKSDTVTIQIPNPKDLLPQKMIHLEYTIGDLEKLLLHDQKQSYSKTK